MRILISTTISICMLILLMVNLYTNEFFVGSILFWILSIGSISFALVGIIEAMCVIYDEYNNQA